MPKFIVCKGASVLMPNEARPRSHPAFIEGSELTEANQKEFVRDGRIQEVDEPRRKNVPTPGSEELPVMKTEVDSASPRLPSQPTVGTVAPPSQEAIEVHAAKGQWNFEPQALVVKSLAELNSMILDKAPNEPPMDTKEEAIAFLSQDFRPAKKAAPKK